MVQAGENKKFALDKFRSIKPQALSLSRESLVQTGYLDPQETLPLVLQPQDEDFDLLSWARSNHDFLENNLLSHGGLLFRNFDLDEVSKFERFARDYAPQLMDYLDQHTPRTRVTEAVYTSTEYPADHHVPFHSENSKNHLWPMKIWFYCVQPAEQGGETPIADNRKVFHLLDARIKERFISERVMYVRNFGEGVGLSWQRAFQTTDRAVVEKYCRESGMEYDWKDGNRLRLRHVCQAIAKHPRTGETVWFNQAHLFHVAGLTSAVRDSLLELFKEEDLPSNAYYGDGSRIEDSVIEEIRHAYSQAAVTFPWQAKDLLMLDNMLVAHGRAPFTGTRKVLVAMAEPYGGERSSNLTGEFN
ncbi:MAG TPA: TauD/TfdA family dioxygenase [Pyrinomonadaceae bacterium]|jgi:alpha-ketoglutarate-dependent taurine dioxygenase|nr:TauD/TfdA family dioxygenase [Pyrinomonadaceae bacterium]